MTAPQWYKPPARPAPSRHHDALEGLQWIRVVHEACGSRVRTFALNDEGQLCRVRSGGRLQPDGSPFRCRKCGGRPREIRLQVVLDAIQRGEREIDLRWATRRDRYEP